MFIQNKVSFLREVCVNRSLRGIAGLKPKILLTSLDRCGVCQYIKTSRWGTQWRVFVAPCPVMFEFLFIWVSSFCAHIMVFVICIFSFYIYSTSIWPSGLGFWNTSSLFTLVIWIESIGIILRGLHVGCFGSWLIGL